MKKLLLLSFFLIFIFSLNSCVVHSKTPRTKIVYVKHPPRNHKIVVIKGKKYYSWNGKNYRKTPKGFVVVRIN